MFPVLYCCAVTPLVSVFQVQSLRCLGETTAYKDFICSTEIALLPVTQKSICPAANVAFQSTLHKQGTY